MGLDDRRTRHDHFHRRAQREGFAARSVYKLEAIDRRFGLLRLGDRVLDLGCAPGSWLQYLERRVGPAGRVVGLDRTAPRVPLGPTVRVVEGDVYPVTAEMLRGDLAAFDAVLSDLAPDTTGIRVTDQARSEALARRALALALELLRPGGNFLAKVFQGPDTPALRRELGERFATVREVKPESSRAASPERYLVALGRR